MALERVSTASPSDPNLPQKERLKDVLTVLSLGFLTAGVVLLVAGLMVGVFHQSALVTPYAWTRWSPFKLMIPVVTYMSSSVLFGITLTIVNYHA